MDIILGLTGGKNIAFEIKAGNYPAFFRLGEINALGFNNQIILFAIIALIAAAALAYTTIGWTIYSVGGNEQAARYAGINTRFVRMRSYVLSSLCAVIAGLMNVAQSKDADPLAGFGLELIAISSVIVGGAAIFGGRGRIVGSCLAAILIGLIDKVLREGVPTTRTIDLGGGETAQVAGGDAIAAWRGSCVLRDDPHHRRADRALARPTPRHSPPLGLVAGPPRLRRSPISAASRSQASRPAASMVQARGLGKRGIAAFFYRRDAAAVILMVALWLFGLWARPDFWGGLDNSFAILLCVLRDRAARCRPHIRNGQWGHRPFGRLGARAIRCGRRRHHEGYKLGTAGRGRRRNPGRGRRRRHQRLAHGLRRPASLHSHPRHILLGAAEIAPSIVAGTQLNGFPKIRSISSGEISTSSSTSWGSGPRLGGLWLAFAKAVSVQTIFVLLVALIAGIVLGHTTFGQKVYAIGGNVHAL